MFYLLIYDIEDNKIRNAISSICKNYGLLRVQKSSFIGDLSKNKAEMIVLEIKELNLKEKDCVFLIPCCKSCFSYKYIIGKLEEEKIKEKDFIVF